MPSGLGFGETLVVAVVLLALPIGLIFVVVRLVHGSWHSAPKVQPGEELQAARRRIEALEAEVRDLGGTP